MILDLDRLFSDSQSLVGVAGTFKSTNALDLITTPPHQIGNGNVVCVHFQVVRPMEGGTSTEIQLVESAVTGLTSETVLTTTGVIAIADMVAGFQLNLTVPVERLKLQFLGLQYVTLGTHTETTVGEFSRVSAGIVTDQQTSKTGWTSHAGFV